MSDNDDEKTVQQIIDEASTDLPRANAIFREFSARLHGISSATVMFLMGEMALSIVNHTFNGNVADFMDAFEAAVVVHMIREEDDSIN